MEREGQKDHASSVVEAERKKCSIAMSNFLIRKKSDVKKTDVSPTKCTDLAKNDTDVDCYDEINVRHHAVYHPSILSGLEGEGVKGRAL